jgi:hypothetical protein
VTLVILVRAADVAGLHVERAAVPVAIDGGTAGQTIFLAGAQRALVEPGAMPVMVSRLLLRYQRCFLIPA